MRVTKEQIVNGIMSFVESEVVPQVGDKATQIIIGTAVNLLKTNTALIDNFFGNPMVQTVFHKSEDGTYEIEDVFQSMADSIKKYGPFPVEIPPVPFISPSEKMLSFSEADINEIKRRIERSN